MRTKLSQEERVSQGCCDNLRRFLCKTPRKAQSLLQAHHFQKDVRGADPLRLPHRLWAREAARAHSKTAPPSSTAGSLLSRARQRPLLLPSRQLTLCRPALWNLCVPGRQRLPGAVKAPDGVSPAAPGWSCIWMELNFRWMMPTILSISFGDMGRVLLCSRRRFITCVVNSLHACKGEKKNHSLGIWYFLLSHPDINSSEFLSHLQPPMALCSR